MFNGENCHVVGIGVLSSVALFSYLYYKYKNRDNPVVSKLIIYPIKSVRGIEVDRLEIQPCGVKYGPFRDRMFALLNESKTFISLRQKPRLALIVTSLHGNEIWLDAPEMETLKINVETDVSSNEVIEFDIFGAMGKGYHVSNKIDDWLTEFMDYKLMMVKFDEKLGYRNTKSLTDGTENKITFQDGGPGMLMNQASIDELNTRLKPKDQVYYRNFRPNIFVTGTGAFTEDKWKHFKINDVTLKNIQPCDRCILPTVNPDTGIKNPDMEPLRTLRAYRIFESTEHLFNKSPLFGIFTTPTVPGFITTESKIEVLDYIE